MDSPRLRDSWLSTIRLPGAKMPWLNLNVGAGISFRRLAVSFGLVAVFALSVLSSASSAVLSGIAAGVAVRFLIQRWNLRRVETSSLPGRLASFQFDGSKIKCFFDEAGVASLAGSWERRLLAAATAGGVCFAVLQVSQFQGSVFATFLPSSRLVAHLIAGCRRASPIFVSLAFVLAEGPTRYWAKEIESAVNKRAATSIERILNHREMATLTAGAGALWEALGVERRGEYQAAMDHYLRVKTSEVVLRPEAALAVLEAMIELGRQDLRQLGHALALYRKAERSAGSVTTLAVALNKQVYVARAKSLSANLNDLPHYAAQRRWVDFELRAAALESESSDLANDLRSRSFEGHSVVLAPGSNPYRLLGIAADTPTPTLRKLRLRLAQLYHPDSGDGTSNSEKMAEVNAAYDAVMMDREKRSASTMN